MDFVRINWELTGSNLRELREHDITLRRNVCRELNFNSARCEGNCATCTTRVGLDNYISRRELSEVLLCTEDVICNWENGATRIPLDDLFAYCKLANKKARDILVSDNLQEELIEFL